MIDMDISTISRVANSKYIDTPYGIKLLKSYFSEGMKNNEGDDISTIEIKPSTSDSVRISLLYRSPNQPSPIQESASVFYKYGIIENYIFCCFNAGYFILVKTNNLFCHNWFFVKERDSFVRFRNFSFYSSVFLSDFEDFVSRFKQRIPF